MLDLLFHLIPKFSKLFSGDADAISAWFWIFTSLVFAASVYGLVYHSRRFFTRVNALRALLAGQTKESLAMARRETLQNAEALDAPNVGMLWREFDESLVVSPDHKQLFNTLDAEHFFNARTLAPGLTASRLLAAAPSFLVAIGVLGTFVGLTVGLEGLGGNTNDSDALKRGIDNLIGGAAVAFMTSVWGVTFSLLLNFLEKMAERRALRDITELQHTIDALYPRIPAEQSLVNIAEHGRESKEALQELHERIGDRLQETITGMTEAVQTALADTLNSIMKPAIQTLVESSSQQSSQVMEQLVSNFMEGMASAGREQGQLMQQAAADVHSAVGQMAERLNHLTASATEQQARQLESAQAQNRRFEEQLERLGSGADERQQSMDERFRELMGGLTMQLEDQLGAAAERDAQRQAQFEMLLSQSSSAQSALLEQITTTTQSQMKAVIEAGEEREQLRQQRFHEQLESVSAQQQVLLTGLGEAVQAAQRQSQQMAEQHQQLLSRLQQVAEAATQSSRHMDSTANQLGMLSTNVRSATELLGERLEAVTQRIESAGSRNAELADQVTRQSASLTELQASLKDAAQRFEQAAVGARSGFAEMSKTQQEFLIGVRHEFTALGEVLRTQVEGIEKQAETWLRSYSAEVSQQLNERMMKWNEVSHAYADQMLHTAQAMSSILDELEAR